MTRARHIEQVVDGLKTVVSQSIEEESRAGYFASLYRQVTLEVQRAIERGEFEDGPRMSRFDAAFGNRYFAAIETWRGGGRPTRAWREAFGCCGREDAAIVQHLLLGVNAHINLDLAIAAAEVAPDPDSLEDLHSDYLHINEILANVLHRVQQALDEVSPLMRVLDDLGGRTDEQIIDFNIVHARDGAWTSAKTLVRADDAHRTEAIEQMDRRTRTLARIIAHPLGLGWPAIELIRRTEVHDVAEVIKHLDSAVDG
jgi:hypothetical protein